MKNEKTNEECINSDLTELHGPLIGGSTLCKVLGFNSAEAFRQAFFRGQIPVKVFCIPNRRGKFAL